MRVWYLAFAAVLWLGIFLTGLDHASWLLYVPAAGLVFAAATGICLTQIPILGLFGKSKDSASEVDRPREHGQAHSGS